MSGQYKSALAYEILTPLYDYFTELLGFGKDFQKKVLQIADLKEDEKVLDVGMGTGVLMIEAIKQHPTIEITGLDPDKKIINIAECKLNKRGMEAVLVKGFAQDMPFENDSFDVAISTLMFHHISTQSKKAAIKEIYRILNERARFILADFGQPQTLAETVLLNLGSIFDGRKNMEANLKGQLPILLQKEGFKVTEVRPRYRGVQFLLAQKPYKLP
jgi:ubiquinone/menaquinone biosynthesis C-methylase UbiE